MRSAFFWAKTLNTSLGQYTFGFDFCFIFIPDFDAVEKGDTRPKQKPGS